jgi:N-acetylglucosamine kinase-like BadF-type ATPase
MRGTSARNVGQGIVHVEGRAPKMRDAMAALDPKLVQAMRDALDEVMTRVPSEHATPETKAYLAECILRAAAQGQTTHDELVAAAANQIQIIMSTLT